MKSIKWIEKKGENIFWPSKELKQRAWTSSKALYKKADEDAIKFWAQLANEGISWYKKWTKAYVENLPYFKWFVGGKLNACYNAIDRHIGTGKENKAAIIWEPEPLEEKNRVLTYSDLYHEVNKFSNVLKDLGVKKGDIVGIYLPMIPEVQIAMLACARIGAVHAVVFSAFSPEALKIRLQETEAKVLITADGYYRRGKLIDLKSNADEGVKDTRVEKVVVVKRANNQVNSIEGKDFWWHDLVKSSQPYCKPETMNSEDSLFILFTSGSTGKPKGVVHTTGGYLTQAYWTTKWIFDLHDEDVFWSTADIGWITGHTYSCYGPLLNGGTIVIYEGSIDFPTPERWCQIIEKHGTTIFYTAPTAIRMFERCGEQIIKKFSFETIRLLGSVGEPIDEESWLWFFSNIGKSKCPIVDTWWQTETGGILISSLPGIGPFIPTFTGLTLPGVKSGIVDENGKPCKVNEEGNLVILPPFPPGLLRGIYKNPEKYFETYWKQYNSKFYFTGDRAYKDKLGMVRITGRTDDIIKVAGHRLSTAEIENAIESHPDMVECAVVPMPHEIKGHVPIAFVVLKSGVQPSEEIKNVAIKQVDKHIGPIARPEKVYLVEDLPKTRSGKIMRRILKNLVSGEKELGDISTLTNPESVEKIKKIVQQ
jgi:acetyl-CoA synthetase